MNRMEPKIKLYDELQTIKEGQLEFLTLLQLFYKKPEEIVYVIGENTILLGIITLGMVSRNFNTPNKWINRGCIKVKDCATVKQEAAALFNKVIQQIPVVDDKNQLLYALYCEDNYEIKEKEIVSEKNMEWFRENETFVHHYIKGNNWNSILSFYYPKMEFQLASLLESGHIKFSLGDKDIIWDPSFSSILQEQKIDLILTKTEAEARIVRGLFYNNHVLIPVKSIVQLIEAMILLYSIVELKEKWERKGVTTYFFESPCLNKIEQLSYYEKNKVDGEIKLNGDIEQKIRKYGEDFKRLLGSYYSREYLFGLANIPSIIRKNNQLVLADHKSKYVNSIGGVRFTTDQPSTFQYKIHVIGPCLIAGIPFVEDKHTIPSYLQRKVNVDYPNRYQVVNDGISSLTDAQILDKVRELDVDQGDIIVVVFHSTYEGYEANYLKQKEIYIRELSTIFNQPHNYGDWFYDEPRHTNYIGNQVITEKIYQYLDLKKAEQSKTRKRIIKEHKLDAEQLENKELTKYMDQIVLKKDPTKGYAGAIVMNCNPFTLGHRYLIEAALQKVEVLYLFVVQEDRSYFSFKHRFELVKEGVKDLSNVIVLPSGSFIISALTFPQYFSKDTQKEVKIDATIDLQIFGQFIARALDIKVRFVGEEPLDPITRQYNEMMKETLPLYGIQLIEIKRLQYKENPISASKVRSFLKEGKLEDIKQFVPESTYQYLFKERYKDETYSL